MVTEERNRIASVLLWMDALPESKSASLLDPPELLLPSPDEKQESCHDREQEPVHARSHTGLLSTLLPMVTKKVYSQITLSQKFQEFLIVLAVALGLESGARKAGEALRK